MIKLSIIFAKSVDWAKFIETDDLSAYILGKLRSTLDWISGAIINISERLNNEVIQLEDSLQFTVLIVLLEKSLKLLSPMKIIRQVAPLSLEKALHDGSKRATKTIGRWVHLLTY